MAVVSHGFLVADTDDFWGWEMSGGIARGFVDVKTLPKSSYRGASRQHRGRNYRRMH
jgi:hypothetical protein